MAKFYAVKVGVTPGVYTTWEECEEMVKGYPGAKFKSFTTESEALAFVNGAVPQKPSEEDKKNVWYVYIDGSF